MSKLREILASNGANVDSLEGSEKDESTILDESGDSSEIRKFIFDEQKFVQALPNRVTFISNPIDANAVRAYFCATAENVALKTSTGQIPIGNGKGGFRIQAKDVIEKSVTKNGIQIEVKKSHPTVSGWKAINILRAKYGEGLVLFTTYHSVAMAYPGVILLAKVIDRHGVGRDTETLIQADEFLSYDGKELPAME